MKNAKFSIPIERERTEKQSVARRPGIEKTHTLIVSIEINRFGCHRCAIVILMCYLFIFCVIFFPASKRHKNVNALLLQFSYLWVSLLQARNCFPTLFFYIYFSISDLFNSFSCQTRGVNLTTAVSLREFNVRAYNGQRQFHFFRGVFQTSVIGRSIDNHSSLSTSE